jgi:phosphatidylserine/phosphatidylglycerophosphate/cardiolipin synthase-like enzyme
MGMVILDNNFLAIATPLIINSKEEILLSSFKLEFTDRPRGKNLYNFFLALFAARARGVKVSVLFNWHADRKSVAKTNFNAGCELKNKNITVKFLPNNRCCHSKLLIIDDEFALVGSHNLSVKSTTENFEISYLVTEKPEIKNLKEIYYKIFTDGLKF